VVAAARAGKHILCEKPMAMNARQCDEMLAAVDQAGVKLQIGFMRRFDADSRRPGSGSTPERSGGSCSSSR